MASAAVEALRTRSAKCSEFRRPSARPPNRSSTAANQPQSHTHTLARHVACSVCRTGSARRRSGVGPHRAPTRHIRLTTTGHYTRSEAFPGAHFAQCRAAPAGSRPHLLPTYILSAGYQTEIFVNEHTQQSNRALRSTSSLELDSSRVSYRTVSVTLDVSTREQTAEPETRRISAPGGSNTDENENY